MNAARPRRTEALAQSAFEDYGRKVLKYLSSRIQNPEDVRELAQQVFLKAIGSFHRQDIREPMAYLHEIARTVLYDFCARQKREREVVVFDTEEVDKAAETFSTDLESSSFAADDLQELMRAIAYLPKQLRRVMTMQLRDGMSEVQIAAALGLNVDTVSRYIHRAIVHIRKTLRAYP